MIGRPVERQRSIKQEEQRRLVHESLYGWLHLTGVSVNFPKPHQGGNSLPGRRVDDLRGKERVKLLKLTGLRSPDKFRGLHCRTVYFENHHIRICTRIEEFLYQAVSANTASPEIKVNVDPCCHSPPLPRHAHLVHQTVLLCFQGNASIQGSHSFPGLLQKFLHVFDHFVLSVCISRQLHLQQGPFFIKLDLLAPSAIDVQKIGSA
mmetsp:Transcript_1659/g.5000  ORF Transcript_1659/g.5000 Transcript_1659/m.5000 type:complete len:206 (-) Transcript_1659:785-1402(-)